MNITKSDPRLTSFVLGELTETEVNEIQLAINADPELQTEIENIRQTVKEIETAMKNEPLPEKLNIIPKRKNWFIRIAAATVAASLLIAGIVVYQRTVYEPEHLAKNEMTLPSPYYQNQRVTYDSKEITEDSEVSAEMDAQENSLSKRITLQPEFSKITPIQQPFKYLGEESGEKNKINANDKPLSEERHKGFVESLMQAERSSIPTNSLKAEPWHGSLVEAERPSIPTNNSNSAPVISQSGKLSELSSRTSSVGGKPPASSPRSSGYIVGKEVHESKPTGSGSITMGIPPVGVPSLVVDKENKDGVSEDMDQKLVWFNDPYNSANDEAYKNTVENEFKAVKLGEFSTFSIDVDTASYTTMRRYLKESGKRPPVDSVRIEEYVNYFKYDYAPPTDGKPFATHIDISPCPWQPKHLLARIGIKGKEYSTEERPALNLVFLIDVSGSMEASNRLPLVKRGLTELVEMLQPKDRVAIVTYAGASRVALPSVSGQEKRAILDSINSLGAGGSTAGAAGIKTAYEVAKKYYDKKAQNRVILCTDGDFNVGETNNKTLETMIGDEAKSGVFLTVLGFGMGNYKDERLKTLSMRGNGNYGYIDTPEEARRLLVEGLTGTLFAIAKDVKIQVDFNPARVAGYRLIGYENRKLRDQDFHNDKIDAGEIGAGHTVTALYELVPAGENIPATIDQSRYDNKTTETNKPAINEPAINEKGSDVAVKTNELLFVKLRYKLPDENKSSLLEYPVSAVSKEMTPDSQFAAAVALFGMLLRESRHSGNGNFDNVLELATPNTKNDQYRKEFIELVEKAKELK